MKKIGLICLMMALLLPVAMYWWFSEREIIIAQVVDTDEQKLRERDKSVSDEKLERVQQEVRSIQNDIEKFVETRYPKSTVASRYFKNPTTQANGRRGQSGFDMSWLIKGKTRISINLSFMFNKPEAVESYRWRTDDISMGEFYEAPEFVGKEGILVKNIQFNQINTDVGLHFVKGRVVVNTYISNFKRKAEKNEKELIEFVRAIEPLITAKANFDDL